ncbi:MAG: hypothetical protein ACO3EE_12160, partial [Flavobacteriales bacterium]
EINSKTNYINRIGAAYQLQRKQLTLGIEYQFLFSPYSGNDLFSSIRTSEGLIISDNGSLIDLQTLFRGNSAYVSVGKIITSSTKNCFQINLGVGILEHHLSIKTLDESAAYFTKNNLKGYDQLSLGPSLKQQFRINHFGTKKRINFYLELFCEEAFLQNARKYNYYNNSIDTKNHFNFTAGIQVAWMIPFFSSTEEDF